MQPFTICGGCCPFVGVACTLGLVSLSTGTSTGGVGGAVGYLTMAACFARKSSRIIETRPRRGEAYLRKRTFEGLWRWCDSVNRVSESYCDAHSSGWGTGLPRTQRARASDDRAMFEAYFEMNSLWNIAISDMYVAIY